MFAELIVARDQTDARREAQRNNSARLAYSQHRMLSTGIGSFRQTEPIPFAVAFLEEPHFVCGATIVQRAEDGVDPVGSSGVWQWQRNPKGHYIGAYIYLTVSLGDIFYETGGSGVRMMHNLLFQGTGYKDLGQEVTTEAQLLVPRSVGFGV